MSGITLKYECDENPKDEATGMTANNEIPAVAPETRVIKEIVLKYTIRMDNNNDNSDAIEHLLDVIINRQVINYCQRRQFLDVVVDKDTT